MWNIPATYIILLRSSKPVCIMWCLKISVTCSILSYMNTIKTTIRSVSYDHNGGLFSKHLKYIPHSSPISARYDMSFSEFKVWFFSFVTPLMYNNTNNNNNNYDNDNSNNINDNNNNNDDDDDDDDYNDNYSTKKTIMISMQTLMTMMTWRMVMIMMIRMIITTRGRICTKESNIKSMHFETAESTHITWINM